MTKTKTQIQIDYLADVPEAAAALLPGLVEHWRHIQPEQTTESRAAKFRTHENRDALPIAWVARSGDEVLGTAALRVHDLDGREDLTPWLGGVFVRREFRGRGIASALCLTVEDKARSLGFRTLFLFTLDQQSLYARLGFRPGEQVVWRGHRCDVMVKDLRSHANAHG